MGEPEKTYHVSTPAGRNEVEKVANSDARAIAQRARPGAPLAGLSPAVSLPPIEDAKTALKAGQDPPAPVVLGAIPLEAIDGVTLQIDQPKIKRVSRAEFKVEQNQGADPPEWDVVLSAMNNRDNVLVKEFEEPVAKICYDEQQLCFVWLSPRYSNVADHLRNCALRVNHDAQVIPVALRQPIEGEAFKLNLASTSSKIPLQCDRLPPLKGMMLQVTDINLNGVAYSAEPPTGLVGGGEELQVFLTDAPLETAIRVQVRDGDDGPYISVSQRYKFGRRWRGYNGEAIADALRSLENSIERNERDLKRAKADLPNLQSELRGVEGRIPGAKGPEKLNLLSRKQVLARRIISAERRIQRLSEAIPESKAMLPQIKELGKLGKTMHNQSTLGFRVYVATESGRYEVFHTAGASETLKQ